MAGFSLVAAYETTLAATADPTPSAPTHLMLCGCQNYSGDYSYTKADAQQSAKFADVRDKLGDIDKAKTDGEKKAAIDAAKALLKRSSS